VIKRILPIALAALAVTVAPASAQIKSGDFAVPEVQRGAFNLAEAYPCIVGSYAANLGIADQRLFTGVCTAPAPTPGAAPGVLCLARRGFALDVNCFAVAREGEFNCVVQAYRLFKLVPGSFKCPDVYGTPHFDDKGNLIPYAYVQFGTGVRTWWSLNFTQPGTRFILNVVSACQFIPRDALGNPIPGAGQQTRLHMDTWRFRVVASVETLANVIELMHTGAVSTLEIPCILAEDMYDALKSARQRLADAIASGNQANIGNAIFDMEALIVANCLFIEVLNPVVTFPGTPQFGEAVGFQPPGNLAQTVNFGGQGTAVAGIIDTIENPCCCKLLVDLEWIALRQGLVGQSPSLPTF
jgi:hypothetical protein